MADEPTLADAVVKTDEQRRQEAKGAAAPVKAAQRAMKKPWIAHLIRMNDRFSERLGSQFTGAITYFTFLSLVPLLMLGFSVAGFVLANQPELLEQVKAQVTKLFEGSGSVADSLNAVIDNAISARFTVGIFAIGVALISGIGWVTNVREAVQAMWRPRWEEPKKDKEGFVTAFGKDLLTLAVIGTGLVVSAALTTVGSAMTGYVARLFGVDDVGWVTTVLGIVPIVIAMAVSTLLFFFLFSWLPVHTEVIPRRKMWRGAIAAGVLFEVFKLLLSFLFQLFSGSATAAVFGSIIALLAIFNLVARMVLMVAAWIATSVPVEELLPHTSDDAEVAVLIRPSYRVRSMPSLAGGLGIGVALGWLFGKAGSDD